MNEQPPQQSLRLNGPMSAPNQAPVTSGNNRIEARDLPFHNWYRSVLSYPPHLVRDYLRSFDLSDDSVILDPFCGTGTTVVEAKLCGTKSIGIEANPFPCFASGVKISWEIDPDHLTTQAEEIAVDTYSELSKHGINDDFPHDGLVALPHLKNLNPGASRALIKDSISPLPLHKALVLLEKIKLRSESAAHRHYILGLGNALIRSIGNLRFGPEVGIGKIKSDTPVISPWVSEIRRMAEDIRNIENGIFPRAEIYSADARSLSSILEPNSIDAVITSPPYPNEKDYTRITRLESVVLGFFDDMKTLRKYKRALIRSNTRGVYTTDTDDKWVSRNDKIQNLARNIESRRIKLGKTSGFEKLYSRVTKLYFGGMARHLMELQSALRPGAKLAYVVGDQASYLQVMIKTGELLAEIADELGYDIDRIDLFRTRFATATQRNLREEIVVLSWPGR